MFQALSYEGLANPRYSYEVQVQVPGTATRYSYEGLANPRYRVSLNIGVFLKM